MSTRKHKRGGTASEERKKQMKIASAKWGSRTTIPTRIVTPELLEPVLNPVSETGSESGSLNNDYRLEPQYIPVLINQGEEPICWAYACSMVLFRIFFRAVYLGYCNSTIQFGNTWITNKNSHLIFNNNRSSSLLSIINFILSIKAIIGVVLHPKNQRVNIEKEIIIYSNEKDYKIKIKLNELRQCIVLSYIFLLLIGIELNYEKPTHEYQVYELILQGNGRSSLGTMTNFIDDIKNHERRTKITKFMTQFWFTPKSNEILLKFLYNLDFRPKTLGVSEKTENTSVKFINFSHRFNLSENPSKIDKYIYNIKLLFKEARKSRVYVLISCNINDIIPSYTPDDTIDHDKHAVYAIPHPVNKDQFIIKNSWGDDHNNIIVSFDNLRNWKYIGIYVCYFNYVNFSKKTRRNYDVIFRETGIPTPEYIKLIQSQHTKINATT